jgi:hypothetical protein
VSILTHDTAFGLLGLVAMPQGFDVKHIDIGIGFDELTKKCRARKRRNQQTMLMVVVLCM